MKYFIYAPQIGNFDDIAVCGYKIVIQHQFSDGKGDLANLLPFFTGAASDFWRRTLQVTFSLSFKRTSFFCRSLLPG